MNTGESKSNTSLTSSGMKFPYKTLRDGQRDFILSVFEAISKNKNLIVEAPTGIGKTMACLFPAVKALKLNLSEKVFYFTPKTSTALEVIESVRLLNKNGADIRLTCITAKEKACTLDYENCSKSCPFKKEYKSRSGPVTDEIISTKEPMTAGLIRRIATSHSICPYEISLDLATKSDLIICDCNYLFDYNVRLKRFFGEDSENSKYVFLFDESHNLPSRVRDMFSSSISTKILSKIPDYIQSRGKDKLLLAFSRLSDEYKGEKYYFSKTVPDYIVSAVETLNIELSDFLKHKSKDSLYRFILDFNSNLKKFLHIASLCENSNKYAFYTDRETPGSIHLFCIDPDEVISNALDKSVSSVFFSATLSPPDYYSNIFGIYNNSTFLSLDSPFPSENFEVIVHSGISTKYIDRESTLESIAHTISEAISSKCGNYMVFLPSYKYLNSVADTFQSMYPNVDVIRQTPESSQAKINGFIRAFKEKREKTLLGFCVLGGAFSEGINLTGDCLIGTLIVGLGLATPSSKLNIIADYFHEKYEKGYEFAYLYPAINKVLQACGRVIRSENDRGFALLIDDRYENYDIRSLFPNHWKNIKSVYDNNSLKRVIDNFWRG